MMMFMSCYLLCVYLLGNVIFSDVHTAMRALQGMGKPIEQTTSTTEQPQQTPTEQQTSTEQQQTSTEQQQTPTEQQQTTPEEQLIYGWRKGKSIKGFPILMRYVHK